MTGAAPVTGTWWPSADIAVSDRPIGTSHSTAANPRPERSRVRQRSATVPTHAIAVHTAAIVTKRAPHNSSTLGQ